MIQAYLNIYRQHWQFMKDYGWKVALVIIPIIIILVIMKNK